jgi:hypothetical protein
MCREGLGHASQLGGLNGRPTFRRPLVSLPCPRGATIMPP